MACNDNPCNECNECLESNPCYDNCGCTNPTRFECITKPGTHLNLGITDTMNGLQVLAVLNTRAANPYAKVTLTQRLDMTNVATGTHVYQTDGTEGVYVYKSTGWAFAY